MINPNSLLADLVDTIRDIPTLMTLLGDDPASVIPYAPQYPNRTSVFAAIQSQPEPSLLVVWVETRIGNRSNGIEHIFSAFAQPAPDGTPANIFTALREGVITSKNQKFKFAQVNSACHPSDVQGCFKKQLVIGEVVYEYHEIPIRITERGADR